MVTAAPVYGRQDHARRGAARTDIAFFLLLIVILCPLHIFHLTSVTTTHSMANRILLGLYVGLRLGITFDGDLPSTVKPMLRKAAGTC